MVNFFLERLKAAAAVFATGLAPVVIHTIEAATNFDMPANWELSITAFMVGLAVHFIPNKK